MKDIFRSIAMAFSMFSVIPTPMVEWKKENMKYMLCALPLVGAVIALCLWLWHRLCQWLSLGNVLFAAGLTLLPLLLSGGIHMDGFCDTVDALSSHASPQRKREILKDSHAGAFAAIFSTAWFLAFFALCTELPQTDAALWTLGLHQIFSRSIGAFAGVVFPSSGGNGLLASFQDAAARQAAGVLLLMGVFCAGGMIILFPAGGVACLVAAVLCLCYLRRMSRREFGGMSGDLAGYLITLSQLVLLAVFIFTEKVVSVCF